MNANNKVLYLASAIMWIVKLGPRNGRVIISEINIKKFVDSKND